MADPELPDPHPIAMLTTIAELIDGQYDDSREFVDTARAARERPHVMDDSTVDRIERVYGERTEWLAVSRAQLAHWRGEKITMAQRAEVDRLTIVVDADAAIVGEVLDAAAAIRKGTIERIMSKSDFDLGVEALMRGAARGR